MEHDLVFYSRMQHLKLLQVLHTGLYMGKVWSCPLLLQFFRRLPWLVVLAAFACPRLAVNSLRLDMNCDEKTHIYIYIQIGSSHQTGEAAMCGPSAGRFFGGFTGREIHGYMAGCFVPISAIASTRCLTGLLDLENKDNALFFFCNTSGVLGLKKIDHVHEAPLANDKASVIEPVAPCHPHPTALLPFARAACHKEMQPLLSKMLMQRSFQEGAALHSSS